MLKENPDVGGEKMLERFLWAGDFVKRFCEKYNKKLTDLEFIQISAKLGETMFVRSEMGRGGN